MGSHIGAVGLLSLWARRDTQGEEEYYNTATRHGDV